MEGECGQRNMAQRGKACTSSLPRTEQQRAKGSSVSRRGSARHRQGCKEENVQKGRRQEVEERRRE